MAVLIIDQGNERDDPSAVFRSCVSGHRHARSAALESRRRPSWSSMPSAMARACSPRTGPWWSRTGKHTGRSAKDKFIVRDAETEATIWWDNNASMTPDHFAALKADFMAASGAEGHALRPGPLRRLAARAPGQRPGDQRARLAQPVHPHPAGPPGSGRARRLRARVHDHRPAELPRRPGPARHPLGNGDRGQPDREADPDRRHGLCRRDEEVGVRHPQLPPAARSA